MRSTILEKFELEFSKDQKLAVRANRIFPDGVTHDNRYSFPFPIYIDRADGSRKWGVGGREFIDYWSGHGALLLGHNPPAIVEAVVEQMRRGTHYGACHELELEWGQLVLDLIPSAERIRFVGTGTEATLMAIRLARTITGKSKVLRFYGHFHGWHDSVIEGAFPPFEESVPGIPSGASGLTINCPPNDIAAVERKLRKDPDIACVILEPTGGLFGLIPCEGSYLHALRVLTEQYRVLFIMDEVVSGFRVTPSGAQGYFGVRPDLTTLAKILAGGLPGGAVAGPERLLDLISFKSQASLPRRQKMPHPGTFNANPLSASAGIEMLKAVQRGTPIEHANRMAELLRGGLNGVIDRHGLNWAVYGRFSEFRFHVGHSQQGLRASNFDPFAVDYLQLNGGDRQLLSQLRCGLLLHGVDTPLVGGLTSAAHTEADVEQTIEAFEQTIEWMKRDGLRG